MFLRLPAGVTDAALCLGSIKAFSERKVRWLGDYVWRTCAFGCLLRSINTNRSLFLGSTSAHSMVVCFGSTVYPLNTLLDCDGETFTRNHGGKRMNNKQQGSKPKILRQEASIVLWMSLPLILLLCHDHWWWPKYGTDEPSFFDSFVESADETWLITMASLLGIFCLGSLVYSVSKSSTRQSRHFSWAAQSALLRLAGQTFRNWKPKIAQSYVVDW